jgi:hypothetical protein
LPLLLLLLETISFSFYFLRAERAAIFVHLLLREIPTPAWLVIVMDRSAWNKMLRSIYTN